LLRIRFPTRIDNVIHVKAGGAFTTISVARYAAEREARRKMEIRRAAAAGEFHDETMHDVGTPVESLLKTGVDLDDRAAVERVLINPYKAHPEFGPRFVSWCIKTAKFNAARFPNQNHCGIVSSEFDTSAEERIKMMQESRAGDLVRF
jgi:hypothetical protein